MGMPSKTFNGFIYNNYRQFVSNPCTIVKEENENIEVDRGNKFTRKKSEISKILMIINIYPVNHS